MIYAPWNEFCMIWVIFLMPTDQVMAFLCFFSDNQSVDMSGQAWGGGRGGHNWKKNRKRKMMYAPWNEFCIIWVIFWMPTDQVMAFLCFISDNQSVDMSGQGWGGGRGGHNWKKQVCLKMLFRQFQVFLAHVFFSYWKIDPRWPSPPPLIGIFQ